jgi:adenine-specific DNA-methyltransferase
MLNVPRTKKPKGTTKVEATTHTGETRLNIPTAELESFAADAEATPGKLLYPRDPTLDPQLVWRGKDLQDRQDLEAPVVPVYIQETIEPRALIEDLRAGSKERRDSNEPTLFADPFEDLTLAERVEFYRHEGSWTNRMILGDSLLVMASLAEKEGLKGQVQMIYMDPPYGIKFGSNWQVSTRKRDVKDGKVEDATRQPEQIRAFRDTWELGIHSYLSYLRDRLVTARDLLAESGSIFVQIGDENVHLVRSIIDEVFGSENFVSLIPFAKTSGQAEQGLGAILDYLLWYAKDRERVKIRRLFVEKDRGGTGSGDYSWVELPDGTRRRMTRRESDDPSLLPANHRYFIPGDLTSADITATGTFDFTLAGRTFFPKGGHWKTTRDGLLRLVAAGRTIVQGVTLRYVRFFDDFPVSPLQNAWVDTAARGWFEDKIYVVQTTQRVVQRALLMATDPGDLVLDPTCGSGTTAYVAESWGRRWITIDTSRVAVALARTRLMTARYPYYLLTDSRAGQEREASYSGRAAASPLASTQNDVKKGFVYERIPHITLKSIAQNPDITEGMTRDEIDAAIARHAETEILYDRPETDPKVVRVSGPFTVESLSPHRALGQPDVSKDQKAEPDSGSSRFVEHIIDNLRKAGVQNTVKAERLTFDVIDTWPGTYIQARGEYTEDNSSRVAAVCIGPENGTVGKELVEAAAKEAVRFADLLVVCGFAFDAYAEGAKALGRLRILQAKMNPDLQMPDLLKKTGAGNLFTVFGEPDTNIHINDGVVSVEIHGLDVYDPTTGVIRSHSTEDIACWFIDTNYNEESFFVRHAYFLGGDDPYERLRKTLRAEIDEDAWSSLYGTKSRPFPKPTTGKIAVKVINHYGDEVLKVYEA